jgi:hypothetical protein
METSEHYKQCVACNGELVPVDGTVMECSRCGGLHGAFDSYEATKQYVIPEFYEGKDVESRFSYGRYFDFTYMDNGKLNRTHGWFDPVSKKVLQFG